MYDLKQRVLGVVGSLAQQSKKAAKDEAKTVGKALISQVGFEQNLEQKAEIAQAAQNPEDSKHTEAVVKSLYGIESGAIKDAHKPQAEAALHIAEKKPDLSPEELQKQAAILEQLHRESYFDPTFNPPPKQELSKQEEQEQEKQQEMAELEEKKKDKPPPLNVRMNANKAEQFPGTTG
jgi:hypothetical protein